MPELYPFRGYRFAPGIVGDLDDVVTQPYDKIPPDLRRDYLARSPFNVAHVIVNSDYEAAGRALETWIAQGALQQDEEPSLYAYQQVYSWEQRQYERTGVIGLVPIRQAAASIKGHEKTMSGPLLDRLLLLRRTETNDGLIFSLYREPERRSDVLLQEAMAAGSAEIDVGDDFGFRHRLWRIRDAARCRELSEILQPLTFYIADGHHRFQTAVQYMQECEQKQWKPGAVESFDKRMMALFNTESPGLRILPTHRGVRDLSAFDPGRLLDSLGLEFEVRLETSLGALRQRLKKSGRRIGMLVGRPLQAFSLTPGKTLPGGLDDLPPTAKTLDVNLLHLGILEPLLGIGKAELAAQSHVDYFREAEELAAGVERGAYQLGFLLRPTTVEQVRNCSEEGLMMPQKSTDFFPKLLTGLVLARMVIDKDRGSS